MFPPNDSAPHRVIAVTSDHLMLASDGNAALFLAQVLFWWKASGRKKFYKFNSPCTHALYREGDSWAEELHLKRSMFATARRRVATKVRLSSKADVKAAFEGGALIVYGTDENHLTWYLVNEAVLAARSPHLYARLVNTDIKSSAPTPRNASRPKGVADKRTANVVSSVNPLPSVPECTTSSLADTASQHFLMQEHDIRLNTETTPQIAPKISSAANFLSSAPSLKPLPTDTTSVGEGEVTKGTSSQTTKRVRDGLQQAGVQSGPARLIAHRALRSGWDATKTLTAFEAHLLDAKRAGARSPVGVAVSRMLDGARIAPIPREAQQTMQRQRFLREVKNGCRAVGERGEGQLVSEPTVGTPEADGGPLLLKALWAQTLGDIKLQITRATFEKHFQGTSLEARANGYVVRCGNAASVEWLTHRLSGLVTASLQQTSGRELPVQFALSSREGFYDAYGKPEDGGPGIPTVTLAGAGGQHGRATGGY